MGLIVDAILAEVYGGAARRPPTTPDDAYELPDNLERFFAGGAGCGSPAAEAEACCEPAATAACCGPSPTQETIKDCGC